jgi:hypothetical protein
MSDETKDCEEQEVRSEQDDERTAAEMAYLEQIGEPQPGEAPNEAEAERSRVRQKA